MCVSGEALVRRVAGDHQEVIIRDLRTDEGSVRMVAERGIRTVPAVVIEGRLLGFCGNACPAHDKLVAAGVGPPTG